jgi:hypothetical protein
MIQACQRGDIARAENDLGMSGVQFAIPRRAADAVNFPALRARARATGVQLASIVYSTRAAGSGQTRVTCSREMALVLVEELLALADQAEARQDTDLLIACVAAASAAFAASGDETRRPNNPSGSTRPAPS